MAQAQPQQAQPQQAQPQQAQPQQAQPQQAHKEQQKPLRQEPELPRPGVLLHEREEQFREERYYIVRSPVPRYFAILVGLALAPLGIAGFVPQFTLGGLLFHVLRTSLLVSAIHLVTGAAGLFAGSFRKGHYAHLYTLILTGIYLLLFSSNNIGFGNAEGTQGGPPDFPWILENALHVGLMLTGALITGLAALQQGDWATAQEFKQRYGLTDPRADGARGHGGLLGIRRLLALLSIRRLGRSLVARLGRAAVLLVLAVAGLVAYDVTEGVVERRAARRLLDGERKSGRRRAGSA